MAAADLKTPIFPIHGDHQICWILWGLGVSGFLKMTMFSAENRRFFGGYGGGYGEGDLVHGYGDSSIGSDLVINMAEDELAMRTDSVNEGGAESSSKDDTRDEEWLQLGIGGRQQDLQTSPKNNGSGLVELELMPTTTPTLALQPEFRPPRPATNFGGFTPSFFSPHHEINWAFRPIPISIAAPSSSSSSFSSYFPRPFQLYAGVDVAPPATAAAAVDFRVIQPPRRPHSGIWFTLQASQNQ